ncbi:response regulator [candidate division GN15 bacterium]|nr:response regulator [candidate division GN15 bacterium]
MAVVTIFGGVFCQGREVARQAASKLGYRDITDELIPQAAAKFNIAEDKLVRAMTGPAPLLDRFTNQRLVAIASLRMMLAELIQSDDLILYDYPALLAPRQVTHVLRVCTMAGVEYRVAEAARTESLAEKEARKVISRDDKSRLEWSNLLYGKSPYDESLYDITIPMHQMGLDGAVTEIVTYAESDALRTTERSRAAAQDFIVAARIALAAANQGQDVDVVVEGPTAYITLKRYVSGAEQQRSKLEALARQDKQVVSVEFRVAASYQQPKSNPWANVDVPPKILLVDDEKEFVHTLSDRLQTRNLESSVVYNGEQALEFVSEDQPDVMVLDLMMPGIDGIEVLRRVKRDHPLVEVIILTGHGSEREEELAYELGAFAYIEKPANINELTRTMKAAYERVARSRAEQSPNDSDNDQST